MKGESDLSSHQGCRVGDVEQSVVHLLNKSGHDEDLDHDDGSWVFSLRKQPNSVDHVNKRRDCA